jgi:hypothetical protein
MREYRRAKGGIFFFTLVFADRSSALPVDQINHLR